MLAWEVWGCSAYVLHAWLGRMVSERKPQRQLNLAEKKGKRVIEGGRMKREGREKGVGKGRNNKGKRAKPPKAYTTSVQLNIRNCVHWPGSE